MYFTFVDALTGDRCTRELTVIQVRRPVSRGDHFSKPITGRQTLQLGNGRLSLITVNCREEGLIC